MTSAPSGESAPGAVAPDPAAQVQGVEAVTAKPLVAAAAEQDVPVKIGELVEATFSTRGGTLKSWRLVNYKDGEGKPLELVPQNIAGAVKPFTLAFDDAATTATLRDALFKPNQASVSVGSTPSSLVFEYSDANGLSARKEFSFSLAQPYIVTFSADCPGRRSRAHSHGQVGTGDRDRRGHRRHDLLARAAAGLLSRPEGDARRHRQASNSTARSPGRSDSRGSTITTSSPR